MPSHDFSNIGDVLDFDILRGTITAVDSATDTCTVSVGGDSLEALLFYHCEPDSILRDNGAIEGAAAGFAVDDEVIVMVRKDREIVKVIAHVDGIRHCGVPSLYVIIGNYCIVWDAEDNKLRTDIPTNESTLENPIYAVFPCETASITNWLSSQTKHTIPYGAYFAQCGFSDAPAYGMTRPQACEFALDAVDSMDYAEGDNYNFDIRIYSHTQKAYLAPLYDLYSAFDSVHSEVESLSSSLWYRVQYTLEGAGSPDSGESSHWWGSAWEVVNPGATVRTYDFFAAGEPYGVPFASIELHTSQSGSVTCVGHAENEEGRCIAGYPNWSASGHTDSVLSRRIRGEDGLYLPNYFNIKEIQFGYSDNMIVQVAHIGYVFLEEDWSYNVPYEGYGVWGGPGDYTKGERRLATKVNFAYNRDGLTESGSYDLRHMPAAPADLQKAIEQAIQKVYEPLLPYETPDRLNISFQFLGWTEE